MFMISRIRRLSERLLQVLVAVYTQLRYGDVYQNWDQMMRLTRITGSDEGDPGMKNQRIAINSLLSVWLLFCAMRISASQFLFSGMDHVLGHTLCHGGNVFKMIAGMAGSGIVACASYRLICSRMTLKNEMVFMRIANRICSNEAKVGMARLVHCLTLAASLLFGLSCICIYTGLFVVNIHSADSWLEICCWIFWYLQDVLFSFNMPDTILFPAIWIMTAINYRMDVRVLCQQLEQVIQLKEADFRWEAPARLEDIRRSYEHLVDDAFRVNKMMAPILFVLTLSAMPVTCFALFIAVYADNPFIRVVIPLTAVLLVAFAITLLALAANITSQSDQVHDLLSIVANRQSISSRLSREQRRLLLDMMEHISSENESLALLTMDGSKFTPLSFAVYLVETGLQYTLLIGFNQDIVYN